MKLLLTAINAKYIHSNLAVYSLKAYAEKYGCEAALAEYTINHRTDYILQELYKKKPDVLMFSCYIWNIAQVTELAEELHKLRPELPIWVGGPEVSYECETFLQENPGITGIMRGEGEATFLELCRYYEEREKRGGNAGMECLSQPEKLSGIPGIVYRNSQGVITATADRPPLAMDDLPFCYESLADFSHRIVYYESSRGCPFRCSYCLSSVEKSLRFRSLSLVYRELEFFLEHQVPQVKFVDRTFNCKHDHAMAIWRFLKEHDNGVTNFHFEISADLLTEEELTLLTSLRPGQVQLEIGVQSTNHRTVEEIRRTMDLERLEDVVRRVKEQKNIHQHLDLIAGLPYEDYGTFQKSFDRIYRLHPEQLQLGFLKVLKGSYMYENRKAYGIRYHGKPPYEVMATNWISYDEIGKIKQVEEMLEVYYNSGQFEMTMQVLELVFPSPFELFLKLGQYYEAQELMSMSHSRIRRCEILLDFVRLWDPEHREIYQEMLTFDLYYRENMKSRPSWAPELSSYREERRRICGKQKNVHLEPFYYDFTGLLEHMPRRRGEYPVFYLFFYEKKNPLTGQAQVRAVTDDLQEREERDISADSG